MFLPTSVSQLVHSVQYTSVHSQNCTENWRLFRKEFRKGNCFNISDSIDIVKEKVSATADVVEQSLEKSQEFAGKVLDSTATLASQKLEKGKEFAESVNQKVHQLVSNKAALAGEVKDAVVDKSQAGAEALGEFATGIFVLQSY